MKRRKKISKIRLLLLVAIPIALIVLTIVIISLIKYSGEAGKLKSFPKMSADNISFTGNGFIEYKDKKLNYYDLVSKKHDFSESVGIEDTDIKLAGGSEINVLYNEISFYIINTQQAVNIENARIIDCKCAKNFAALLIMDNDTNKSRIEIYNSAGSLCINKNFDTTMITNFGFENELSTTFYYSELSTAGENLTFTITTFDLQRNSVNGVISVYGMVVENVIFTEKSIFVVGTKYLIRFDRVTNKEVYRLLIYGYKCYSVSMNNKKKQVFALAEIDSEKPAYVKLLTVSEGESANSTVRVINLPDNYIYFTSLNGSLAVVTDTSILKYNANGTVAGCTKFDEPISKALKLNSNNLFIKIGERYGIFKLK